VLRDLTQVFVEYTGAKIADVSLSKRFLKVTKPSFCISLVEAVAYDRTVPRIGV
jgi:hypothetical protein